jgi:predicted glutamine amidotransferase
MGGFAVCELLGMSFEQPVSAEVTIRAFAMRDMANADGWGLGWFDEDYSLAIVKEPLRWRESRFAAFLQTYEHLRSRLIIGHVRHATTGGTPTRADTHPFTRELFGRFYCFAHNGTVRGAFEELPLGRFRPVGLTDSEHMFCHLLDQIAERGRQLDEREDWQWLHERLAQINEMGKVNCVLSDGRRMLCYRDRQWKKGLMMRSVTIDATHDRRLEDATMELDMTDNVANRGVVVATRPLTDEPWHPLRCGELLVLHDGEIQYSTTRHRGPKFHPASSS